MSTLSRLRIQQAFATRSLVPFTTLELKALNKVFWEGRFTSGKGKTDLWRPLLLFRNLISADGAVTILASVLEGLISLENAKHQIDCYRSIAPKSSVTESAVPLDAVPKEQA